MDQKIFPIQTQTACQLKWTWSTIYLSTGTTASCHRTHQHPIEQGPFNFHNTEEKLNDRKRMLEGKWPEKGCEYCQNIEAAGGASDRITNLDFWDFDPPKELVLNPQALSVTPRIVEIYFNNTCNLKCTYCGPNFSSLWADELRRFEAYEFKLDSNFELNKQNCFKWLQANANEVHQLSVLGGEPLYQIEFDQLLDVLDKTYSPKLTLAFFSNLAVSHNKLVSKIDRIEKLIKQNKIKKLIITASLDCWGAEQEYARFPINLNTWEKNFNYLLDKDWITIVFGSTITPLTIKSLSTLFEKINKWNEQRPVYWYGNSVNWPEQMYIDIFGNVFDDDFSQAIDLMPEKFPEHISVKEYLKGIRNQVSQSQPNLEKIKKLYDYLETLDSRRGTSWRTVYPWMEKLFHQHLGDL